LSNFGINYTRLVNKLEKLLCLVDRKGLITSSGHTALMAAYNTLDIKRPLIPAYTFNSTYSAATLQGIIPTLTDVDINSGCLTLEIIKEYPINTYDSIVLVCALSTIPNLEEISDFCLKNDKKLIIDAAAAIGTHNVSNYGDAVCYSFHATKVLPFGEAGLLVIKEEYFDKAKSFITFGFNLDKDTVATGMNAKVSEYTCAIGLSILDQSSEIFKKRLENLERYKKHLSHLIYFSAIEKTVHQSLPISVPLSNKIRLQNELKANNIEYLNYYKPLINLPNTKKLYETNISLPIHQDITFNNIDLISSIVLSSL
jgi:dTDP-4-amino-4,6-dideoxygalactose transaminase